MPRYEVVFNKAEKFSSDAAVGTSPIPQATIVGPVLQANHVTVEAESVEAAEHAVRVAYNGITNHVEVWDAEPAVDPVEAEQDAEPDAEPQADAEPVVKDEPVASEPKDAEPGA